TKLMSNWFQDVQETVEKNLGMVDKFIGDCVLAKWEVDSGDTESLFQALKCSIELNKLTSELHNKFPEIQQPLKIGVGLNQGEAAVGIGVDNTIMGDVVNTAFRLETASKDLDTDVVMNSSFYSMLPDNFPLKDEKTISVKGKATELKVSSLSFDDIESFLETR
ncbi:MAG: adenylate/guanylate cyclase domain-containing protein, partial [Lentisphaeraceae bacterium]|nr:adenylate/guanylate cyclase domain-containing protein [Lentisphaeraceae bacterium]